MVLQGWEAMAPRLQVQMPGEQSVLPPRGSAGVAVASSREEGGSGERTLASSWAVGSPLKVEMKRLQDLQVDSRKRYFCR